MNTRSSARRQQTLFDVRRGPVKRARDEEGGEGQQQQQQQQRKRTVEDDFVGKGTTTDVRLLHPVRREAFLEQFKVQGLTDVYFQPRWVPATEALRWLKELDALEEWYRPTLKVYGKEIRQSRAIAAYGTAPGMMLKYSGHQVEMHHPFPPLLEQIAARLATETCLGADVKFNHCMLNRYEDGSVYIGRHSDNLENKVIVTISLGAERTWIMEEKVPRGKGGGGAGKEKGEKTRWTLPNGSLLVMQGDAQRRYTHEIPKQASVKQARISVTFRQLV